jgi:hypothetical protein
MVANQLGSFMDFYNQYPILLILNEYVPVREATPQYLTKQTIFSIYQ